MSDNCIRIIPAYHKYVPGREEVYEALEYLSSVLPDTDQITSRIAKEIVFVDCGSNLEHVYCPGCGTDLLKGDRWQELMDNAERTEFKNLDVVTPCCGKDFSLNDFLYDMPAGFSRFIIEILNPATELSDDEIERLEILLKRKLRIIYTRI